MIHRNGTSMRGLSTVVFILAISLCGIAAGNNNLFLPGDAFFPTELTAESLAELKASPKGEAVFKYSSFGGYDGAFCGYAGYGRAKISELDEAFVANLAIAYAQIRKSDRRRLLEVDQDGKTTLVETNGVRVLFYPHDFDVFEHNVGLQYNENWVAETVKFRHRQEDIRLCCLVDDKDAIERSWRDAAQVAALQVTLPDVELKPLPPTLSPVILNGRLKAIVLDSQPLTAYFRPEDFQEMRIVDSAGVKRLVFEDGQWAGIKNDD